MKNIKFATFSSRIIALIIDCILLSIPVGAASYALPVIGSFLVILSYAPILESSPLQATVGKYWMGIQVTDLGGNRITLGMGLLRCLSKFFSSLFFGLGYLLAIFTERHQTFHDLVSQTLVVQGKSDLPILDTWLNSIRDVFRRI